MNELDKIKAKLKKLFALSRSPNPNEAAVALEMAQKLMIEHGIKRNEVGEFEVIDEDISGIGGKRPPQYATYLTSSIATAFGCRSAYGYQGHSSDWYYSYYGHTFVGLEHRVQIACFVAEVLLRKMKKARSEYVGKLKRVRSRTNKTKRADVFCLGWAYTVVNKLNQFTNTPEEQKAIDSYVANLEWGDNLKPISRGRVSSSGINDFVNGHREGAGVQIRHGISGHKSGALLLEEAPCR